MKRYLSSLIWGTVLGLVFLLLGLAGAVMFISNWNGIFLVWSIFCVVAVFYILWMMRKRKLDLDDELGKTKETSDKDEVVLEEQVSEQDEKTVNVEESGMDPDEEEKKDEEL